MGLHKDISWQSFFLLRYQPAWLQSFAMFKRHRLFPIVRAFCCNTSKIIPKVRFMIEEVGASASREGVPPLAPWKRGESSQGDAGPRAWPCPPSEKWDETVEEKAPQTVLLRLPVLQRGGAVRTRRGGGVSFRRLWERTLGGEPLASLTALWLGAQGQQTAPCVPETCSLILG